MHRKRKKMEGKKAISMLVSYILLISLALAMSALVYAWLKSRIPGLAPKESCPEGVSLVIESYNCTNDTTQKYVDITVRNRGLFTVEGFIIKMSNSSKGIAGMYPLCIAGTDPCENVVSYNITPSGTANDEFSEKFVYTESKILRQVEIEPIWKGNYCEESILSQAVICP